MLSENGLNVEYMYAFGTKLDQHAMIIFKTEDNRRAAQVLREGGAQVLDPEDVRRRLHS